MKRLFIVLCFLLLTVKCFAGAGIMGVLANDEAAVVGGCAASSLDITDSFTNLDNFTQDQAWLITSGVAYPGAGGNVESFLRHNTTLPASCQWVGANIGETFGIGAGSYPGVFLRATGATGYRYVLRYDHDNDNLEWVVFNGDTLSEILTTQAITALSNGDTLIARAVGTGDDTELHVWINPTGGTSPDDWGASDYTFTDNPTNAADTGTYIGLYERYSSSAAYIGSFQGGN